MKRFMRFMPVSSERLAALGAASSALASMRAFAQSAAPVPPVPSVRHAHHHRAASAPASADQADADLLDADDATHLLIRTGFAPANADVAPYVGLTRAAAVDHVLSTAHTDAVTPLPAWISDTPLTRAQRNALTQDQRRDEQRKRSQEYDDLRAWWMREILTTPSPLTERMTLFWHNHFTSGQDKIPEPQLMAQQNTLLRRHALGSFAAMLHDVAKDPAMLLYLDGASNRRGKPNENFAREVMELFTLGEGQYTQRDVSEAARAYTGWGVDPDTWRFDWRPQQHDDGIKTVLGHAGTFDGDAVLDILLGEPQTAHFVTAKLWCEFVSDTPDPAQLDTVAERFRSTGYDIKAALGALLVTPAFWDARNRGVLVSSPVEFIAGTVRRFDVTYANTAQFARTSASLGENLFYPPNVKGWPGGATWINSSTLLARKQFVEQLFRSTGPERAPGPAHTGGAMTKAAAGMAVSGVASSAASGVAGSTAKAPAKPMPAGMHFDLDGWLGRYGLTAAAVPGLSAQLQMQHAVLPLAPVDAIAVGSSAESYLQALLMDPVYQLK